MQQGQMYKVSQEINALDDKDASNSIDKSICKSSTSTGAYHGHQSPGVEAEGKCGTGVSSRSAPNKTGLSALWEAGTTNDGGGQYDKAGAANMGDKTSAKISQDIRGLTREQHGVVSSAFAKAHEGAEIVIAVDIHH